MQVSSHTLKLYEKLKYVQSIETESTMQEKHQRMMYREKQTVSTYNLQAEDIKISQTENSTKSSAETIDRKSIYHQKMISCKFSSLFFYHCL